MTRCVIVSITASPLLEQLERERYADTIPLPRHLLKTATEILTAMIQDDENGNDLETPIRREARLLCRSILNTVDLVVKKEYIIECLVVDRQGTIIAIIV